MCCNILVTQIIFSLDKQKYSVYLLGAFSGDETQAGVGILKLPKSVNDSLSKVFLIIAI